MSCLETDSETGVRLQIKNSRTDKKAKQFGPTTRENCHMPTMCANLRMCRIRDTGKRVSYTVI